MADSACNCTRLAWRNAQTSVGLQSSNVQAATPDLNDNTISKPDLNMQEGVPRKSIVLGVSSALCAKVAYRCSVPAPDSKLRWLMFTTAHVSHNPEANEVRATHAYDRLKGEV
eukprot:2545585-Amphidinium_carterae.1